MTAPPPYFSHERLEAYQLALDFVRRARAIASDLPRGHASLANQLRRAANSIALNIAEGAGESSAAEKARIYRIARRSALESAACLDVIAVVTGSRDDAPARNVLHACVRALHGLIGVWEERE